MSPGTVDTGTPGRPTVQVALNAFSTVVAVLGAGTLVVPAVVAPTSGGSAISLLVAALLLAWCLLVAAAGGTRLHGAANTVRTWLGARAARSVHGLYFVGIAVGQAALAAAAGAFAGHGTTSMAVASVVLGAGVLGAAAGVHLSPTVLRFRLTAVLVLVAWNWLRPGLFSLDTPQVPGGAVGQAAVVMFAWVGMESAIPALRRGRPGAVTGTLIGLTAAGLLYALLLVPGEPTFDPGAEAQLLGVVAAGIIATYCLTNLRTAARNWDLTVRTSHSRKHRGGPGLLAASTAAAVVLVLAEAYSWSPAHLLLVPGMATISIYAVVAVAAVRRLKRNPSVPKDVLEP